MTVDERISEAEDALHELMLGRRAVTVTRSGKTVTFTQTNRVDLELYIAKLKQSKSGARRRPMRPFL
ncbi:gpW family head-tail joining protein [Marinomonas spartinae]|uniref:gpW family head-tail joining protein n=1 Tax=Marinomonas spartinae TaxID=1792290 RepID=UPI0018F144DC|nr:gpW family head-tail joining protein [Marinomonas spartinae]MBJ7555398.1 phage tail protein [Marinomonas spartinae]